MDHYWFNRQEILQKAKEKAAEYYKQNKEAIKEKSKEHYKNLPQEEKDKIKEYQKRNTKNWFNIKKMCEKITFSFFPQYKKQILFVFSLI